MGDFDLVSAKDMIAAVERALNDVAARPDAYPLHASLLADVGALKVQQARSALARTDDLVREAPKEHAAIFSANYARELGLPVSICDPSSDLWKRIWRLWMHYYVLGTVQVYENEFVSQVHRQSDE